MRVRLRQVFMQGFCLPNDFSKATLKLRAKASDNRRGHRRHFAASFQSRSSEFQKSAFFFLREIPFQFWRQPFKLISKIDGRTYDIKAKMQNIKIVTILQKSVHKLKMILQCHCYHKYTVNQIHTNTIHT